MGLRLVQRQQAHLEAAPLHAQALHGRSDGLGQAGRTLVAQLGQALGLFHESRFARRGFFLQTVQVAGAVNVGQLGFPVGQALGQFFGCAAVAPRQRQPAGQAFVQGLQGRRVDLGVAAVVLQAVHAVL